MKPAADKSAPAVYKQIEKSLRARIADGHWVAGTMLPSRRDLAREYGVSSVTVERAITRLIAEGVLRADDRRGTFVTNTAVAARTAAAALPQGVSTQVHLSPGAQLPGDSLNSGLATSIAPATIGIVASLYVYRHDHLELNNFWVRLLVQSLEQSISADGHTTRFFNRVREDNQGVTPLSESIAEAIKDGVDALVLIAFGMNSQEADESLSALDLEGLPVVCITSGALRRPVPHVFYNNHIAGYQAAHHLLRRGAKEIVFCSPFRSAWSGERLEGVRDAVDHAGLAPESVTVYPEIAGPWVQEEDPEVIGYDAAINMFRSKQGNGQNGKLNVICVNDGVAFGLLEAAKDLGLVYGRDFSLVGFDDHPQSRARQVTSLRPPMDEMGRAAARLLLGSLHGEQSGLQVCLRWLLIPRSPREETQDEPETSRSEGDKSIAG